MTVSAARAEGTFAGTAGREIFWRSWSPSGAPRGLVAIAHGFGEHSGRYEHVAGRLVAEGFAVYALDHHGHGRSSGARARISFQDAVADLDALIELGLAQLAGHARPPVFLLGHSMGGAIALRHAMAHGDRLTGLVVSGPLAEVDGRAAAKLAGRLLGAVAPGAPVARLDPALVSRDPAVVAAYESDPLVHHAPLPAGTVAEFLRHADTLPHDLASVHVPTLVMYGTADRLCSPAGCERVAERLRAARGDDRGEGEGGEVQTISYDGLYHEILNEPERERVLDDLVAWLVVRAESPEASAGT